MKTLSFGGDGKIDNEDDENAKENDSDNEEGEDGSGEEEDEDEEDEDDDGDSYSDLDSNDESEDEGFDGPEVKGKPKKDGQSLSKVAKKDKENKKNMRTDIPFVFKGIKISY